VSDSQRLSAENRIVNRKGGRCTSCGGGRSLAAFKYAEILDRHFSSQLVASSRGLFPEKEKAMAAKDFGAIESDYEFFVQHATEAENDVAAYCSALAGFAERRDGIRMLDFGCGTGEFTERFLAAVRWPPQRLELMLVEPVAHQRKRAGERLSRFCAGRVESSAELPTADEGGFDLILSNHALYYAESLDATLRQMVHLLGPRGVLQLAIAGWENSLIRFWIIGFESLGERIPYFVSEDVESLLRQERALFRKTKVAYRLRFPDSIENRRKILRFLFGEHFSRIDVRSLLPVFDEYAGGGVIDIPTHSDHFELESPRESR